ncbi:hypothetical protein [[Phormidium] sp. ETS-05]|uniref:hypothetical protein n=1 Tax=[Phormidium] sp. ETS-05 TaxID=222819 RepID=UPI0018EF07B6|nr:hypothetical protein [[Phormidium] sp. ETS-05]
MASESVAPIDLIPIATADYSRVGSALPNHLFTGNSGIFGTAHPTNYELAKNSPPASQMG